VGQQFGNYRLLRLLGYGGFAEVYLGEHVHLQTQAAIKVLSTQLVANDLERFIREARTIASLEHPHIVRVLDFGIESGIPFLVMSYAPNGTLRQRHPKESKVALANVLTYVVPIASALQYAHDRKLIHRDVKPENMLLGNQNEALLSDFGIATTTSTSTSRQTKTTAGTAAYMAPEQIMSKPDIASDQYALGMIVYEWLSGDQAFHGSFFEMCAQHLHAPIPSLREKNPAIPVGVEQCILKTLAKQPDQRFARIQDFALALQQSYHLESQTNVVTLQRPPEPPQGAASGSNAAAWPENTTGEGLTYINPHANDPTVLHASSPHTAVPGVTGSDDLTFVKDGPPPVQPAGTFPNDTRPTTGMPTAMPQSQRDQQAVWAASTRWLAPPPVPLSAPAINPTTRKRPESRVIIAVTLSILLLILITIPFFVWFGGQASTGTYQPAPPKKSTSVSGYPATSTSQSIVTSTPQSTDAPTQSSTGQTPSSQGATPTPKSTPRPTPTPTAYPTATPTPTPLYPTPTPTMFPTPTP